MKEQESRGTWKGSILLTLMAAMGVEVCLVVFRTWSTLAGREEATPFVPWTFHTLWEVGFMVVLVLASKRCGTTAGNFLAAIMLGSLLSAFVWLVVPSPFGYFQAPYVGVSTRLTLDQHEADRLDQMEYDFPLSKGLLYHSGDPALAAALSEELEYAEFVAPVGFFFWQTGLANGFDPSLLDGYNGGRGFLARVELFFTVGPVVLAESGLTAAAVHFPLFLLIVLGWYAVKRSHLWFEQSL